MEAIIVLFIMFLWRNFTIWCAAAVIRLAAMFAPHSLPHMNFVNILFVVYSLWVINMAVTGNYRKSS